MGVPGRWRMSVPGWRWVGSLSIAHTVPWIKNLMVLTCAAALTPTGLVVKGVVSVASCVGMWAQPLTLTSIFVELFSIMAVPLLVFRTLTATREDVKHLVVISVTFTISIIPDILRYASFTHALTRLQIINVTV